MSKLVQLKDSEGNIYPKIRDVYSYSEIKTNKIYIDENGKEWNIYRKRKKSGYLLNNDTSIINMGVSNIKKIIDFKIIASNDNGSMVFKIPFIGTDNMFNNGKIGTRIYNNEIYIRPTFDARSYFVDITLEYTKTSN